MQPGPSIADLVGRIAAAAPGRIAAVADGEAVSYAALHRRIGCIAGAVAALGVGPGQVVAVGVADPFLTLLLLAGFDQCGVCSAAFRPDEGETCHELIAGADLVLTDTPAPPGPCRRHLALDAAWWARVAAAPPLAAVTPVAAEAAMMVIRSSGTTGRPKRLRLTRHMLAERCAQRIAAYGMNADTRYLLTMAPSVYTIMVGVVLTWQLGGMVVVERRLPLWLALTAARPTHVTLLPQALADLLDALPQDFVRLPGLHLVMLGARLPVALRAAALARLAGGIVDHYGTNEAGLICRLDDAGRGAPVPGQTVAVLDPDLRPVAVGETGLVAVRGPAVAIGYLDAPALTARHFCRGWFLTDDLAMALGDGRLLLVGREGEVLNIGGHKFACADLEAALRHEAGLDDVAVLPGEDAAPPVIACVLRDAQSWAQAAERIRASLPALLDHARLCAVAAIPRTPEGKVRRPQLRAMLQA